MAAWFMDVATGRMEKPYLNPTRTEEDFVKAVRALVETDPKASCRNIILFNEAQNTFF